MWLTGTPFLIAAALIATGCSDGRQALAEEAATAFARAAATGELSAACAMLAPATGARVERAGPCIRGLGMAHLPTGARALSGEVWGDQAQVRTTADTVFLTETPDGWKVTAAGCQARPEAPYECAIEGP